MQFIDLKAQQDRIRPEIERRMKAVLDHGQYIMGPEVAELEERLAAFVGTKHCISNASGTDGLLIALMALGISAGDEVITTPFTFIATAEVIRLLGAVPVFVDIDPQTYNIDPQLIEQAITPKTKAIMPVSLYGQCADLDAINTIAARHNLPVIEDGAQSLGATINGRQSCSMTTIGVTSFFPSKPLGCYGDGGACFTNDDDLAVKMRQIRVHGQDRRYHHPIIGINGRLDTLQAAILLAKLDIFPEEVELRQAVAQRYNTLLVGHSGIVTPQLGLGYTSVYAQYTVQVPDREVMRVRLKEMGTPTAVHYPVPLYLQPAFADLGYAPESFPVSTEVSERVMSLPMHPYLTEKQQQAICSAIRDTIAV